MRWRVLAGVVTLSAVVTQVRQVMHIGLSERGAAFHCRKNGAKAFAVSACVANGHQALAFPQKSNDVSGLLHARPPVRRYGRTPNRWSCQARPDIPYLKHFRP